MSANTFYEYIVNETPTIRVKQRPAANNETPVNKLLSSLMHLNVSAPPSPMALDSPPGTTKITPVLARLALSQAVRTPTRKLFGMFNADAKIRASFKKEKELEELKKKREQMRCWCPTCGGGRFSGVYCCAVTTIEFMDYAYDHQKEDFVERCWCSGCGGGMWLGEECMAGVKGNKVAGV